MDVFSHLDLRLLPHTKTSATHNILVTRDKYKYNTDLIEKWQTDEYGLSKLTLNEPCESL